MANVFISYERGAEALVRKMRDALIASGHSVWSDADLPPHRSYSEVIEERLAVADAVLVLWSTAATRSQWVRAEAENARQNHKLVQLTLDGSLPPMPFNQIQCAQMQGWTGDRQAAGWLKVLSSLEQMADNGPQAEPPPSPRTKIPRPAPGIRRFGGVTALIVSAMIGVVLVGAAFWVGWALWFQQPSATKIAVLPFETVGDTPSLRQFASGLSEGLEDALNTAKLPTLPRGDAAGLARAGVESRLRTLGVRLLLTGSVTSNGPNLLIRMHLDDPIQHVTVWTAEITAPETNARPLQAQAAARTTSVLGCAAKALRSRGGLSDSSELALYFHACDLAETSGHGSEDSKAAYAMLDAFRNVIARAPTFADAHAVLAKHLAFVLPDLPDDQQITDRKEAAQEAQRALQLDPKSADAYVALSLLEPQRHFAEREALLNKALAIDPDWPHANGFLGNVLGDVGRENEASLHYDRAAAVNPQSLDWGGMSARGLTWTGRTDESRKALAELADLWPNDVDVWRSQIDNDVVARDWSGALTQLDRTTDFPGGLSPFNLARRRLVYTALKNADKAGLSSARATLLKDAVDTSNDQQIVLYLSLMGFADDAFALADRYAISPDAQNDSTDFLFTPALSPMRRDPRFMALSAKFGLANYWRQSGKWPDFCAQPDLPYTCRVEAEKALKP